MNISINPSQRPQGCTNLKLRQFMRRIAQHFDNEMGKSGLKTTQYSLLTCVEKTGPIRPVDLALNIKIEPSTLTRNLKPLLDAGWVTLSPGNDGRSRQVEITESGRAKRAQAKRHWRKAQDGINALLGMEAVSELHKMIDSSMDKLNGLKGEIDHE